MGIPSAPWPGFREAPSGDGRGGLLVSAQRAAGEDEEQAAHREQHRRTDEGETQRIRHADRGREIARDAGKLGCETVAEEVHREKHGGAGAGAPMRWRLDRKSVVWGKSVSVRVDRGGRRII